MRQSPRVAKVPVTKEGWQCDRCGHQWIPKRPDAIPAVCPTCKSPYWNRPRKLKMPTR